MFNNEIEFKTLLTRNEFQQLKTKYTPFTKIWQKNFYFDTPDFQLKKHHSGLRIRLFSNHSAEATLKTPAKVGLLETTERLSDEQLSMDWHKNFPDFSSINQALYSLNVNPKHLSLFAELETERFEKELEQGIYIMLDHSQYYGTEDFELEMEVPNLKIGQPFYKRFLKDNHLSERLTINKIARATKQKKANLL